MLDRVTITGADNSIPPEDLIQLSWDFPFVEWGILVSEKKNAIDCPRFPSWPWLSELKKFAAHGQNPAPKLSLHVCGRWVRELLLGTKAWPAELEHGFQRIQLNFHGGVSRCDVGYFTDTLKTLKRPIIFQLDDVKGRDYMVAAMYRGVDAYGLFDKSGGAGISPDHWPRPCLLDCTGESPLYKYSGYAGGLGPDNLAEQIPEILEASDGARSWIDMETKVRAMNGSQFDYSLVRECLEIAKPFVRQGVSDGEA